MRHESNRPKVHAQAGRAIEWPFAFCAKAGVCHARKRLALVARLVALGWLGGASGFSVAVQAQSDLNDLTGPWQLFVDDYAIAGRTNAVRVYHSLQKHAGNPVMVGEKPWEQGLVYLYGTVLRDESGSGYRMWYHCLRTNRNACTNWTTEMYAFSSNGIHWTKPVLNLRTNCGSATNNMYFTRPTTGGGITSVMHTPWDPDPEQRYKLMSYDGGAYRAAWSSNGIHIMDAPNNPVFTGGSDVGQFCWDPHTQQYLGYVKNGWTDTNGLQRRAVARTATTNITVWPKESLILWPDAYDDRWSSNPVLRTHFYGLSAFPYETMYAGFLWVFRATNLAHGNPGYLIGFIHCELVTSRDGLKWQRPEGDRAPILPLGANGTWDDGMVFTARAPVVEGDTLKVWYGGFNQPHDFNYSITHASIGLATLRKDGFASLDADGGGGVVVTRSLMGADGPLQVNYRTNGAGGWLKAEVLDHQNNVLPGYSQADCVPLTGNSVTQTVIWTAHEELPANVPLLRLRFVMQNASVYSFMPGAGAKIVYTPIFTQQPQPATNYIGTVATFEVQAEAAPPPAFRWQKNGVTLADGGHYSGCDTRTLTVSGVDHGDFAVYSCVASNVSGSVTSSPALLTVRDSACLVIGNADFEGGFSLAGGGYIANQWKEWEAAPGVTIGYDETQVTRGGAHAHRLRVWGVTNTTSGGIYQRVPATPGQPFNVSIWVYAGDDLTACSLGVDPAGGTNAAGAVAWSSASTNVAWAQKTVAGFATANFITIFLKVAAADVNKRNGYFDDVGPAAPSGTPVLAAQRNQEALALTWPECPAMRLEQSAGLLAPAGWLVVTNQPVINAGQKRVVLSPAAAAGFFRLTPE